MPSNKKQMFVVIEKFAQCNEIEFSGDCEDQSILIGSDNTHSVQFQLQWSNDHYIVYLILKPEKEEKYKETKITGYCVVMECVGCCSISRSVLQPLLAICEKR